MYAESYQSQIAAGERGTSSGPQPRTSHSCLVLLREKPEKAAN